MMQTKPWTETRTENSQPLPTFIFTEAYNCGKITRIALESFHRHHDLKVHVFGTLQDFEDMGPVADHHNTVLELINAVDIQAMYMEGHKGTAYVFALVLNFFSGTGAGVIHFDGDVFFKSEAVSLIEDFFKRGWDIVGSRRCYGNNPSGVPGLEAYPDTISTYFTGIRIREKIELPFEQFHRMCQGAESWKGIPVLDFFDPVTHYLLERGAQIDFISDYMIGGQDESGKKPKAIHPLNAHMDCGLKLIHFGGVGSGYAYNHGHSNPEKSYGQWALGRWALFAKVFYDENIVHMEDDKTVYLDGRWVSGTYDYAILEEVNWEVFMRGDYRQTMLGKF